MRKYYYDLHIHSCLSPCGDDDNTPNNIAGMASLSELDIIALTDHNSTKNCKAFFDAARKYNLIPIAGMELTTSEDIHVVCLFERLEDAICFDEYLDAHRNKIKNRPNIFGNQTIYDSDDNPIGEVEDLLINATSISITDVKEIVENHNGICYPAHIDRDANGIIAVLGALPEDCPFEFYELYDKAAVSTYSEKYKINADRFLIGSDAHYLTDFKDKENYFSLPDELCSEEEIRHALFKLLRRSR